MKYNRILPVLLGLLLLGCRQNYPISGPQGGIAVNEVYPKNFHPEKDSCDVVILMHGIFSSKDYAPIPSLSKSLAKDGYAAISLDFGGHGKSEGTKQAMTIEKELQEARALVNYVAGHACFRKIYLLGHSQGGVIASMLAGRLAEEGMAPAGLILMAPGSVIKEATLGGRFFGKTFDPANPPEYIKCFGFYRLGRDYLISTQQLDIYGTSALYEGPVCIIHGTKDGIVPLWCSERYDSIYVNSHLHLVENENHLMVNHLKETYQVIKTFLKTSGSADGGIAQE